VSYYMYILFIECHLIFQEYSHLLQTLLPNVLYI
jgi:hypothetical protein